MVAEADDFRPIIAITMMLTAMFIPARMIVALRVTARMFLAACLVLRRPIDRSITPRWRTLARFGV